jgi:hypothetical protein
MRRIAWRTPALVEGDVAARVNELLLRLLPAAQSGLHGEFL